MTSKGKTREDVPEAPNPERGAGWHDAQERSWFAAQTKPFRESLAAVNLRQRGYEVFLPRARVRRSVGGIERPVVQPLFPGYLFLREAEGSKWAVVPYIPGILRILANREGPVGIPASVVEGIRGRLDSNGLFCVAPKNFEPGEEVVIEQGPFAGFVGRIERELDDHRRVSVFLETLYQARVMVQKRWLAAA